MNHRSNINQSGFTMIELVVVIILLGILAATALPRYTQLTTEARIAALEGIAGAMLSTISLTKAQARLAGLSTVDENPRDGQIAFLVETELGTTEIDWRNLCPESRAELGDALNMADFMRISLTQDMSITTDNRFTLIGYELAEDNLSGCYVRYDSFGLPDCTVEVIVVDC